MKDEERKLLQPIFELGAVGILRQGKRAMMDDNTCAYRDAEGLKCFIGHAIPDEKYSPEFEGSNANEMVIMEVLGLPVGEELGFCLRRFQTIHDAEDPKRWPDLLRDEAERQGLDTSCLDQFRAKENA